MNKMDTIKENEWIILSYERIPFTSGSVLNYLKVKCPVCLNTENVRVHLGLSDTEKYQIYCSTCEKEYALQIGPTSNNIKRSPQEICQENKLRDKCIQCGRDLKQHPSFSSRYMYCGDCCD
jgi:hypothetical protein